LFVIDSIAGLFQSTCAGAFPPLFSFTIMYLYAKNSGFWGLSTAHFRQKKDYTIVRYFEILSRLLKKLKRCSKSEIKMHMLSLFILLLGWKI